MTRTPSTGSAGADAARSPRLVLFVAGDEPNSRLARENLRKLCDGPAAGWETEVIDVYEDYRPAIEHQVLVTPCLLVRGARTDLRVAGTLSDLERIQAALRIVQGT